MSKFEGDSWKHDAFGEALTLHRIYADVDKIRKEARFFKDNWRRDHDDYTKNLTMRVAECGDENQQKSVFKTIFREVKTDIYVSMQEILGYFLVSIREEYNNILSTYKSDMPISKLSIPTKENVEAVLKSIDEKKLHILNEEKAKYELESIQSDFTFFTNIARECMELRESMSQCTAQIKKAISDEQHNTRMRKNSKNIVRLGFVAAIIALATMLITAITFTNNKNAKTNSQSSAYSATYST